MIKKIATAILALSMTATSTFSFLSASADSKPEPKGVKVKVDVQGYLADEWLAEHDELDVIFEHNGDKTYGFLNKDNNFEKEIELEVGTEYNVTLSDDFEGYVVSYDDRFTPENDGEIMMVTVLPTEEKKDNTLTDTLGKLAMNDEELSEYRKQRELVQQFIELTEKYGLCDDTNPYWQTLSEEDKKNVIDFIILPPDGFCEMYCEATGTGEEYADVLNAKYGETDNKTLKKRFAFNFLIARIYVYCHEMHHSNDEFIEMFCWGTSNDDNFANYYGNYDSIVKPILDYDQNYWDNYHEIPNLYEVYLDILNGVELEDSTNDTSDDSKEETSSSQESAVSVESKDEMSSELEQSSGDTSNSKTLEPTKPKNMIADGLKNNIITIILAAVLGGALLYIRKLKKNSKKKNNDY